MAVDSNPDRRVGQLRGNRLSSLLIWPKTRESRQGVAWQVQATFGPGPRFTPPSAEFAAAANAGPELQAAADADRLAFWDTQAKRLDWATEWSQVLDWSDAPSRSGLSAAR